jgi:hypothetical protein
MLPVIKIQNQEPAKMWEQFGEATKSKERTRRMRSLMLQRQFPTYVSLAVGLVLGLVWIVLCH